MNWAPGPVVSPGGCFISRADGRDVFVHYSKIGGYGLRSLKENRHVEFEVTQGLGLQATHARAA